MNAKEIADKLAQEIEPGDTYTSLLSSIDRHIYYMGAKDVRVSVRGGFGSIVKVRVMAGSGKGGTWAEFECKCTLSFRRLYESGARTMLTYL